MKNSIAFNLAKASVLKDKKNYTISFFMMIIAFMFSFIFSGYLTLSDKSETIQRKINYGGWSVAYENQSESAKEFFKNSEAIDAMAVLEVSHVLNNGNYVANYSEEYFTMNSITLLEGTLPSNKDEVVVMEKSGAQVGNTIEIRTVYPEVERNVYKVVGIINDYNALWTTPSADWFVSDHDVYKDYTYISSSLSMEDLIGVDDCIYNYSLLNRDVDISICKTSQIYWGSGRFLFGFSDDNYITIMNTFIIVVSAGLFISVFYNINQREKNVFLLRCIGMSKKDMRSYLFYEIIIVAFIALIISFVVGSLSLLCMSAIFYQKVKIFLFVEAFTKSLMYIGVLLVIIVSFVYLSMFPISIHSMDSLIHKKERKVLKKYHKVKKMNISNLSNKISSRHAHFIAALAFLILVEVICIEEISGYIKYNNTASLNTQSEFVYFLNYKDDQFIENMSNVIKDYRILRYADIDVNEFGDYYFYDLKGMETRLEEGRLPENNQECLVYNRHNDYYATEYNIGDVIDVAYDEKIYNENGEIIKSINRTKSLTIVGTIDLDDYYSIYNYYLDGRYYIDEIPLNKRMFVAYSDVFSSNVWDDYTYLKVNKDIYFQINELSNKYNDNIGADYYHADINNLIMIGNVLNVTDSIYGTSLVYVPVLLIAVLFVGFMVKLLVDKLNKDFKLVRCLGMTFKQTMMSYLNIGTMIIIYPIIYYLVRFMGRYNIYSQFTTVNQEVLGQISKSFVIAVILSAIHLLGFMFYAYKKTSSTVTFYPSDVERYY